jgi:hypothetical protein
MHRCISLAVTGLLAAVFPCGHAAVVVNGDFESGNTGFISDYTYVTVPTCDEAEYSVVHSAVDVHASWVDAGDHTTGNGLYFVANGSSDTGDVVWQTANPISVTQAGTPYRFEAWITSVYAVENNGPILRFQVGNGTQWFNMGTSQTFPNGYTPGQWRLSYYDGTFDQVGTYYLRLMNDQNAMAGNDLGIDDIYFGLSADAPSIGENPVGDVSDIPTDPAGPLIPEPATVGLAGMALLILTALRAKLL